MRSDLPAGTPCMKINRLLRSEKGIALVLTLLILVLITAMVTEFAYGVFTATSALYNWKDSQRLSLAAKSGINVAVRIISDPQVPPSELYKYLGKPIPVPNILEGFEGSLVVKAEDENGKFNLNSLRKAEAQAVFLRLLKNVGFNERDAQIIGGRVIDWIDVDSVPASGFHDSEQGAKNAYMDSVDELLLIKGIDRKTYEKLLPYVTAYGNSGRDDSSVNMNTASIPVIMSLSDGITRDIAERIIEQRSVQPFAQPADIKRAGIDDDLYNSLSGKVTVSRPVCFRITAVGEENKIRRMIESVIFGNQILYWREM